ncbi:hypothetical protein V8F06_009463 [Rhypophila decipiens]
MVSLVPVLLTTILAILTQVLTSNISSMLPFRGLSYGADTRDTLLLPRSPSIFSTSGINIRFLTHYRDPLPLLNTLLSTLSTILVPISSEAIRLEISTTCSSKSKSPPLTEWEKLPTVHCAFGLRRSIITVRVTEATLVIMTLLIVVLCYMLLRWKTGVEAEPWSIASMAGLLSSSAPKLQAAIQSTSSCLDKRRHSTGREIRDVTSEDTKWRIGYYHSPDPPPGQHQVKPASGANNRHYGCMYYLTGSGMLKDFEGLGLMSARKRDRFVIDMGRRYTMIVADVGASTRVSNGTVMKQEGSSRVSRTLRMRIDYAESEDFGNKRRR